MQTQRRSPATPGPGDHQRQKRGSRPKRLLLERIFLAHVAAVVGQSITTEADEPRTIVSKEIANAKSV